MNTKQVIVIRKDLKMRKGKMVSQGAHVSLKVFFDMMIPEYGLHTVKNGDKYKYALWLPEGDLGEEIKDWMTGLYTKITCGCDSLEELENLYLKAQSLKLPCSKITDVGLTEFKGVPTVTAIAIGPAESEKIDLITGNLNLL